jgi:hypothetical protein
MNNPNQTNKISSRKAASSQAVRTSPINKVACNADINLKTRQMPGLS